MGRKKKTQTMTGKEEVSNETEQKRETIETLRKTSGSPGEQVSPGQTDTRDPGKPKRRRRRARKEEEAPVTISKEAWTSLVGGFAEYVSRVKGDPKWLMTPQEAMTIGEASDRVASKYFPLLMNYQEEVALGLLFFMYWLPRAQTVTLRPPTVETPPGGSEENLSGDGESTVE